MGGGAINHANLSVSLSDSLLSIQHSEKGGDEWRMQVCGPGCGGHNESALKLDLCGWPHRADCHANRSVEGSTVLIAFVWGASSSSKSAVTSK